MAATGRTRGIMQKNCLKPAGISLQSIECSSSNGFSPLISRLRYLFGRACTPVGVDGLTCRNIVHADGTGAAVDVHARVMRNVSDLDKRYCLIVYSYLTEPVRNKFNGIRAYWAVHCLHFGIDVIIHNVRLLAWVLTTGLTASVRDANG